MPQDASVSGWVLGEDFQLLVQNVLSSECEESERDAVGAFLQHLVELAAFELERTPIATPLSPQLRQLLARLFLCDYECNYFLNTYGAVSQKSAEANTVNGAAAMIPPGGASQYFVAMFNKFHSLRGFSLLLARCDALLTADDDTDGKSDGPSLSADAMEDVALLTQIVYEARFVLAKKWVLSTWLHIHPRVTSLVNRYVEPVGPVRINELMAHTLYRLDATGRALSRAYFLQWDWLGLSDVCASYNLNHALLLLADEDTALVTNGAHFIAAFLAWVMSQPYYKKLEPTWAISDWLVANSVAEALSAAGYDPRLRASQQKVLTQAATVVSKYLEKIAPRRTADATPPCPVKLSLKSQFGRPSFGALTLDVNAQVATVRDVYELASGLLRHPVSRLHLQTQAGKHVMFDAHADWAIAAVTPACTLDLYVLDDADGGSDAVPVVAADSTITTPLQHAAAASDSRAVEGVSSLFGTPIQSEMRGFMATLGRNTADPAAVAEVVNGNITSPRVFTPTITGGGHSARSSIVRGSVGGGNAK